MSTNDVDTPGAAVDLYWLPLGAGEQCVRWSGRAYELAAARYRHRDVRDLYHAALVVTADGDRYAIEMAPVWGNTAADRGVVSEGAVGLGWLGRSRWFRYEVRRWKGGSIPDLAAAVDSPHRASADPVRAREVLELIPAFPTYTWGRDALGVGDMWNSNSLIAWLLARTGHDMRRARPPAGGRAPGWDAGLELAGRQSGTPSRILASPRR